MSSPVRVSGLAPCRSFLRIALVALAGFCCSSQAQTLSTASTAPQLLPYTITKVAGGATANPTKGTVCASGNISTDAYGDGCLATEVVLNAPRFVTTDKNGAVFFSDTGNGLVRRIDPVTGIITAVAGGATSSPGSGSTCGANKSTDSDGDGCLGTLVKIGDPEGLAFSPAGDLYFADEYYSNVRKIAATGGTITSTGIISNVAGSSTYGYNVDNTAGPGGTFGSVLAASQSYLNDPYGVAFDAAGNLYIADEYNDALEVVNLTSATETLQGMTVPAGTIAKFVGYGSSAAKSATSGDCPDFVSTSSRGGCYYGAYTSNTLGNESNADSAYDVAVDPSSNVFFADEYEQNVGLVTPANLLTSYAGIEGKQASVLVPSTAPKAAGSFAIGGNYNVAVDSLDNVYTSDAYNGVIWRIDGAGENMYVIAGGATNVCSGGDAYGDGCPATQAKLSVGPVKSGYSSGPGVAGIFVDPFGNLYITDVITNLVREASSGTQFGNIGANQPTNYLDIHFAAGDSPAASSAYTLTAGATNFSLGNATCTSNSDSTTDCVLPVTATPTALGPFTGTLQVTSKLDTTGVAFPLSGDYVASPDTKTAVSAGVVACAGTTSFTDSTPLTLTATVNSSGSPTGTVTFYANGTQIGSPAAVNNSAATLTYTFSTPGVYAITATYGGDSYYLTSTTTTPVSITSVAPTFSTSPISNQQSTVAPGQTALYSFNIASTYLGTVSFACSGLPANSSCSFSPPSITATGCTTTNTVALSILTQQATQVIPAGWTGRGRWQMAGVVLSLGLALLLGLRRRKHGLRYGQLWIALLLLIAASGTVACGKGAPVLPGTPAGTSTVTVTVTGSAGSTTNFTVPLTVN